MASIIILRGIPGSGKSTLAREAKALLEQYGFSCVIVSADHYFEKDGEYKFDRTKIKEAHDSCKKAFFDAIKAGVNTIIVDNTNTRLWEFQPYVDEALAHSDPSQLVWHQLEVVRRAVTPEVAHARCVHGVPLETIQQMHVRMEPYVGEIMDYD